MDVAKLDRPGGMDGGSREEALFCAAILHRYGLPVDYARMESETPSEMCARCKAPLSDHAFPAMQLEWTNSSPSSVTWEGVGETEGDCKPMT